MKSNYNNNSNNNNNRNGNNIIDDIYLLVCAITKTQGRFITAAREIQPGEVFALDRPQIRYLDPEYVKVSFL